MCAPARVRGCRAVFTQNTLEVAIYQHLCAVKKHTSCCCPFIRFSEESGPHLWPGCIILGELASFWPSGTRRNRFERQDETWGGGSWNSAACVWLGFAGLAPRSRSPQSTLSLARGAALRLLPQPSLGSVSCQRSPPLVGSLLCPDIVFGLQWIRRGSQCPICPLSFCVLGWSLRFCWCAPLFILEIPGRGSRDQNSTG